MFAGNWYKTEHKTFRSNVHGDSELTQHDADNLLHCKELCLQNSSCVAITYNDHRDDGLNDCVLRKITKDELVDYNEFIYNSAVDYFEFRGKSINSINISHFV